MPGRCTGTLVRTCPDQFQLKSSGIWLMPNLFEKFIVIVNYDMKKYFKFANKLSVIKN